MTHVAPEQEVHAERGEDGVKRRKKSEHPSQRQREEHTIASQTAALIETFPQTGRLPVKEISIAKAYSVEKAQEVYDKAIQVHGGMGLSNELPLEEGFRICRTLRIPDGTGEIQRRTIARQMLRGDTVF